MIKRAFDVVFSLIGLVLLAPLLILIAIIIKLDSKGPVLFIQGRVGKNNKDFKIFKFRTMRVQSHKKGLLTLGNDDSRITKTGYFLRRYKIDEFPQLINILIGDMSFVGPRPELRYYVNFYNEDDMGIFAVRPGITGLALFIRDINLVVVHTLKKGKWGHKSIKCLKKVLMDGLLTASSMVSYPINAPRIPNTECPALSKLNFIFS